MQVTYTHKKISFGARTVAKQVELLLATPAFHTIVPRIDSSLRGGSSSRKQVPVNIIGHIRKDSGT